MDPPEGPTLANLTDKHVRARGQKTSEGAAALSAPGTMLEMGK